MDGIVLEPRLGPLPGPPVAASLPGAIPLTDGVVVGRVTVRDVRGRVDLGGRGVVPPHGGAPVHDGRVPPAARGFGVFGVASHLARAVAWAERGLGRPLPPVLAAIGQHALHAPAWSGGHYRLPARRSRLPERVSNPSGEIHLGVGRRPLPWGAGTLWDAAAHNPAIVLHEFGHHVVRHTADPRANRLAAPHDQDNRKTALDEGTADYVAAVLLETPDIYGWQRGHLPRGARRRRDLDAGWTMAAFRGGGGADPHADGQVWAGALWAARTAVAERTGRAEVLDGLLLHALDRMGWVDRGADPDGGADPRAVRRRRRHFSAALAALLDADEAAGAGVGDLVEKAFGLRGIALGASNADLAARCTLPVRLAGAR